MDVRGSEDPTGAELYTEKNRNLELSLDFSNYSTDLYRRYFERLVKRKAITPVKILDLAVKTLHEMIDDTDFDFLIVQEKEDFPYLFISPKSTPP